MAVEEFSLDGVDRCNDVVAVDDREFLIFRKANLNASIRHGLAEEQVERTKTQMSPAVDLEQLCTLVVHIALL